MEYGYLETTHTDIAAGEVEDDLQCKGLRILQARDAYCFSSDSALLANFATMGEGETVCELCAGSAVVSLLLCAKTPLRHIVAVELQYAIAERAARSVARNGLTDRVSIWWGDLKECASTLGAGSMDAVVANPPYYRVGEGKMSDDPSVAMCRHETHVTLHDVVTVAGKLLRYGGRFYIVYTAGRLAELLDEMMRAGIEPKKLVSVQPAIGKAADTVLVEGRRGGKPGMVIINAVRGDMEARFSTRE
jgi:tRNA1(Val) A37 N6-methylase TrmN6